MCVSHIICQSHLLYCRLKFVLKKNVRNVTGTVVVLDYIDDKGHLLALDSVVTWCMWGVVYYTSISIVILVDESSELYSRAAAVHFDSKCRILQGFADIDQLLLSGAKFFGGFGQLYRIFEPWTLPIYPWRFTTFNPASS